MKNFSLAFFLAITLFAKMFGQTTLVNFDFNGGSGYPISATSTASNVNASINGTEANAAYGGVASGAQAFVQNNTAGNSISMANSSGTNTKFWTLTLSGSALTSYQSYKLYFQSQRSNTGATSINIYYSTDGSNYTLLGQTATPGNQTYVETTIDLSSITAINGAATIYIKLAASGASGSGTLRIDNLQVQASTNSGSGSNPWVSSGNDIFNTNMGNIGIGNTNPQYKLDVMGDAKISNNLFVGGAIITTGTVNVTGEVNGGNINVSNALTVAGNVNLNGTVNINALGGSGVSQVFVDNGGNLFKEPYTPPTPLWSCWPTSLNWNPGGNFFTALNNTANPPPSDIGTCDAVDFILKANNVRRQWIKPDGSIGFGTSTPTQKFHFSGGNVLIDELNSVNVGQVRLRVKGGNNIGFCSETDQNYDYGFNTKLFVNRSTTHFIGAYSTDPNNTGEFFVVWGDGRTYIGKDMFHGNGSMLTVGQPDKTKLALSLVDNTIVNAPKVFFNVYGNGKTEINATTLSPMDDVFTISNNTNVKNFSVKNNGYVYAREINVMPSNIPFPDYVFDSSYNRPELLELDNYIKQNKHLPNIPNAKQVEKDGINLAEMQIKQMEKIEELFLYVIELKKENEVLKAKVEKLSNTK